MFEFWSDVLSIIGAVVSACVALVVVSELGLWLWAWIRRTFLVQPVNRYDFLPKPYFPYLDWIENWSKPMFFYHPIGLRLFNLANKVGPVDNNSLGYRAPEFTDPDPDELRIVVLGGSAAWGFGASHNDATIACQVERLFNEDRALLNGRKRARCFNLAQVDGCQTQDLLTALLYFSRIRPDIVVSLNGWNELPSSATMSEELLQRYRVFYLTEMEGWVPIKAGNAAGSIMLESFWMWGSRRSQLVAWLAARRHGKRLFKRTIPEAVALSTPLFLEHLERMVRLSKGYDFSHFQFCQPHLYRKLEPSGTEPTALELYDVYRPIYGGKAAGDYLRNTNIYEGVMTAAEGQEDRYGVLVDLGDMFREETDCVFHSLVHCNDEGYRRMAERMYFVIKQHHHRAS